MIEKLCRNCGQIKSLFDFHKCAKSGFQYTCKACKKIIGKINEQKPEIKAVRRAYKNSDRCRAISNAWVKTEKGKQGAKRAKEKSIILGKNAAYLAVNKAIKAGLIQRTGKCTECGLDGKTHMHHPNGYEGNSRLNVVELCFQCHHNAHEAHPVS